jgi:hypothetical protein
VVFFDNLLRQVVLCVKISRIAWNMVFFHDWLLTRYFVVATFVEPCAFFVDDIFWMTHIANTMENNIRYSESRKNATRELGPNAL